MTTIAIPEPAADVAKPYQPMPEERAALGAFISAKKKKPPAPELKVDNKNNGVQISIDHADPPLGCLLLMQAIGTTDASFLQGLLKQLADVSARGQTADAESLNFVLSVVKGIEPRDQIEAMLATQMAAVHLATMTFARRLAHVDNIPQQDSAERAFNKLARTFSTQVEALKRYRTGGEQRVTVQYVTVNEGGRAIVGAVSPAAQGGGV